MGLIRTYTGLVLTALFVIAMIMFATNLASDNSATISIADDSDFATTQSQTEGNISQFYADANASMDALMKSTISSGDEATESGGQFKGGIGTMIKVAYSSIGNAFSKIFGEEFNLFLNVLIAMMVFIIGWFIYKAWVGRSPD